LCRHFPFDMETNMATIVLKNVPAGLREQLELRARASGRSVEREVIACLESVVGTAPWDPGPEEALLARARKLRAEIAAAGGRPITNEEIDEAKRKGRP
jgi:plasmid stability protein